MGERASRPWVLTTVVFLLLTLMYWSQVQITVQFLNLERPTNLSVLDNNSLVNYTATPRPLITYNGNVQTSSPSARPASAATPRPAPQPSPPALVDGKYSEYKAVSNVFPTVDKSKGPKTNATTILESSAAREIQDQFIPKEGTKSPTGLTFSLDTFSEQKQWQKSISIDPAWKDSYNEVVYNAFHPCCGVTISTNDCGHAIALTGLTKKMLKDGKSVDQIRTEIFAWERYYFPRHYVLMALAVKKEGKDASIIDLSQNYATVQSEQYATDYLVY